MQVTDGTSLGTPCEEHSSRERAEIISTRANLFLCHPVLSSVEAQQKADPRDRYWQAGKRLRLNLRGTAMRRARIVSGKNCERKVGL